MKANIMLSNMEECPSVKFGEQIVRFEIDPLSLANVKIAKDELRETPEIIESATEELKNLLKLESNLITPLDNKYWLIRFLRPCKYYPESAKDLIKEYFNFKQKHANIFDNLYPHRETNVFKADIVTIMPNRDQLGRRMLLIQIGKNWNHKQVTLDEIFKACVIFLEIAMLEEATQVNGAQIIFDMDGLSLSQAWQFTPLFAKRIVDFLQDAIPVRVKGIHIVNEPKVFQMVFALFKPFLKEKLRKRMFLHKTDRESFHSHISPKCLPAEYGGTSDAQRITSSQWYELLLKYEKEFDAINSCGYKS